MSRYIFARFQRGKMFEMPRVAAGANGSILRVDSLIAKIRNGCGAD